MAGYRARVFALHGNYRVVVTNLGDGFVEVSLCSEWDDEATGMHCINLHGTIDAVKNSFEEIIKAIDAIDEVRQ